MNRALSLSLLLITLVSGCSFLNPLFYEAGFRKYAERIVGLDVEEYTAYPYVTLEKIENTNEGFREYFISTEYKTDFTASKSTCHWVLITEPPSSEILSWRYVSKPEDCKGGYFYSGAW